MAKLAFSLILIFCGSIFASMPSGAASAARKSWFQNICRGNEKVAKLHFYVQNVVSGPNPTTYVVASAKITDQSPTSFGQVRVLDDPVTAEPDFDSEVLGRFQGLVTSADSEVYGMAFNLNFYFTSGKYRGSTLSILGRNPLADKERELAVVGGTGVFRFARGYAITTTYSNDVDTGNGVFEYTLYVTYVNDSAKYAYI